MTTLLLIVGIVILISLLVVLGFRPQRTQRSWSELRRQNAKNILERERMLSDIVALRRVVVGLLLIAGTLVGYSLWQAGGVMIVVIVWLLAGVVVRWKPFNRLAMQLYDSLEPRLLRFLQKTHVAGWLFRAENYSHHEQRLESIEHLRELIEKSGHIMTDAQQTIVSNGLDWPTIPVKSVMVPRSKIVSVKSRDLLGPLVLNDLHTSGHSRFPVARKNIDDIIGVVDIAELLEVDSGKSSQTAERVMSPNVMRIEQDETLPVALDMLQKSHQHLLVVVDVNGKTAGIVTLTNVMGALLGKNRGEVI